jgi:hypothetical protein
MRKKWDQKWPKRKSLYRKCMGRLSDHLKDSDVVINKQTENIPHKCLQFMFWRVNVLQVL